MSYPDHEYYITFLFERLEDFKASVDAPQPQTYGQKGLSHMQTRT